MFNSGDHTLQAWHVLNRRWSNILNFVLTCPRKIPYCWNGHKVFLHMFFININFCVAEEGDSHSSYIVTILDFIQLIIELHCKRRVPSADINKYISHNWSVSFHSDYCPLNSSLRSNCCGFLNRSVHRCDFENKVLVSSMY